MTLSELTTLRVGGPVGSYIETTSEDELVDAVRSADAAGRPVLVLGGGSNLLVGDDGFDGIVVRDIRRGMGDGISAVRDGKRGDSAGVTVTVPAGHDWDAFVAQAVANHWVGVESLSGIPGTVGAAPVQNIGAYGQEVADVITGVRIWDRSSGKRRTLSVADLGFGYRTSVLKRSMQGGEVRSTLSCHPSPRYVVLDVQFQMGHGPLSSPVAYAELARQLGVDVGSRAPLADVRQAVLTLRAGKGMLTEGTDETSVPDHDRWSAGSFFTNPILSAEAAAMLPDDAPRFAVHTPLPGTVPELVDGSLVKTSAAWLIEQAGFGKGFGLAGADSPARLSTRHTLALTNRGGATAEDVVALARAVRDGVRERFGVVLEPEPVLVGLTLSTERNA